MRGLVMAVVLGAVLGPFVFGATIHVPSDQPTIQAGIDAAADGDTVLVADGAYHGEGNLDITFNGKAVVLTSANGADFTTISYRYFEDGFFAAGCFKINSGVGPSTVIDGFTLTEADADPVGLQGKAMHILNSSPTIRNCRIVGIRHAAPVLCEGASPVFDSCLWDGNTGGCSACKNGNKSTERGMGDASAVRCVGNSNPRFLRCTFIGNVSDVAGGVLQCDSSSPTVIGCRFANNVGYSNNGVAVECWNGAAPLFQGCRFTSNYGHGILGLAAGRDYYAGAVYANQASPIFENCVFDSNAVAAAHPTELRGGAVLADSLSDVRLTNCTFVRNSVDRQPYSHYGVSVILATRGGSIVMENSIAAYSMQGPPAGIDLSGSITVSCTDIFGNEDGGWTGPIADQLGMNGNISVHPLFCDTAAGAFHVAFESPCAPEHNSCDVLIGALPPACGCCRDRGDVNHSGDPNQGDVDVGDLTYLINHIFRSGPPPPCPAEGDASNDGDTDIGDLTYLVNFVLRGGPSPAPCN